MTIAICPTSEQWKRFAAGEMSDADLDSLEAHLAGCTRCAAILKLEASADEPLLRNAFADRAAFEAEASDSQGAALNEPTSGAAVDTRARWSGHEPTRSRHSESLSRPPIDFLDPPQRSDEIGRFGPFRILDVLGQGGMGVVFRAEEIRLERLVAVKVMHAPLQCDSTAKERFHREAKAIAKLRNDHIVTIHHVGEERGIAYLAIEFLQGESLEQRMRRNFALPVAEVLRIGREIAAGLAAAHDAGVIHRDVKPANIWIEDTSGRVKILDFGLARLATDDSGMTFSGAVLGTPAYMAPEQASDDPVDARCDLFSLGCVLYAMATGETPFKGRNALATLSALARVTPVAPAVVNAAIPIELSRLIMSLLEKDRERRLASAEEVVRRIRQIETQPSRSQVSPTGGRRAIRIGAVSLSGLLVLSGIAIFTPKGHDVAADKSPGTGLAPDLRQSLEEPSSPPESDVDPEQRRAALVEFIELGGKVRCDQSGESFSSVDKLPDRAIPLLRLFFTEGMPTPDAERLDAITSKLKPYWIEFEGEHARSLAILSESPIAPTLRNLTFKVPELLESDFEHIAKFTSLGSLRIFDPQLTGGGLRKLKKLQLLQTLELAGLDSQVSPDTLAAIAELPFLVELNAGGCHLSAAHCRALANSKSLNHLTLGSCGITDEGIASFARMPQIKHLSVVNNPISARGLANFKTLRLLERLDLRTTRVTPEAVAQLRSEMPNCKIDSD